MVLLTSLLVKSANAGGTAGKTGAVAIGDSASASGTATVAVGKRAQADLDNDNAFGNSVHANAWWRYCSRLYSKYNWQLRHIWWWT